MLFGLVMINKGMYIAYRDEVNFYDLLLLVVIDDTTLWWFFSVPLEIRDDVYFFNFIEMFQ